MPLCVFPAPPISSFVTHSLPPLFFFFPSSHLSGPGRESLLKSLDEVVTLLLLLESPRGNTSMWKRVG